MSTDIQRFDEIHFETVAKQNGSRSWLASDFMTFMGYADWSSFKRAVNRAMSACATLDIPIHENFKEVASSSLEPDFRLSRFACYLIAMNGDVRKPQVAGAQAYFAGIADAVRQYVEQAENVERVAIRSEVSEREKSLSRIAKGAGVSDFALFRNAGYRGMYNMHLNELKRHKGLDAARTLLDYMGKAELAANLFRVTQTEQKINNENIRGQGELEDTAYKVGRKVRETMRELSGTLPEDLPLAENIKTVQSSIRRTQKTFAKMDSLSPTTKGIQRQEKK